MKLADALVTTLRDWDVRYVFGVSGANIEHVHDAIHRLGGGRLRSVLAKSEVGAAFMADCRARVHRTLGVCSATSGGGMMNLAVGVAEAYAESVPMLALVGQVPSSLEGRGGFQDSSGIGRTVDAVGLWRSMAKFVAKVESGRSFWSHLHGAIEAALSGRPGPSVLLLPRDVYDAEVGPRPTWLPTRLDEVAARGAVDAEQVQALFELIKDARRPVLVAGTGVARSSDPGAVTRFAIDSNLPVVTTMGNPGAFPNDDPLFLGMIGAAGHPSAHAYLDDRADLILAVGTGLDVMTRSGLDRALDRARIAVVNVDAGPLLRTVDPELVIESDAGRVFRQLLDLRASHPFVAPPLGEYALTRHPTPLAPPLAGDALRAGTFLRQSEALDVLSEYLPRFRHVLYDAGNCAAAALHALPIRGDTTSTIALGMGGMGYAIAGAIGAQLGDDPDRGAVVVCGDGAFLMTGLEVHTAVELGLPILFVVFNNGKHGMCVTRQQLYFAGRIESSRYDRVDVATVARGLGPVGRLWIERATTRAEVRAALDDYFAVPTRGPGVLELELPIDEVPPFAPFLAAAQGNEQRYAAA
jgi:acetolactate synthase-1/2/3 large subunit